MGGCGGRLVRASYDDPYAWNVLTRPTILYANFKNQFTKERKKKHNIDKKLLSGQAWTFAAGAELSGLSLSPGPVLQRTWCLHTRAALHRDLALGNTTSAMCGWSDMPVEAVVLWDLMLAVEGWINTQPPAVLGKT